MPMNPTLPNSRGSETSFAMCTLLRTRGSFLDAVKKHCVRMNSLDARENGIPIERRLGKCKQAVVFHVLVYQGSGV